MHFDVPVGQPLPCYSRASPSRPEPTVRFPRVGHELTHVVVFGVVKGEVFEVCRNETHPSQATNEASHGISVLVDEGPARATHSRLDCEPVHRIFLKPSGASKIMPDQDKGACSKSVKAMRPPKE